MKNKLATIVFTIATLFVCFSIPISVKAEDVVTTETPITTEVVTTEIETTTEIENTASNEVLVEDETNTKTDFANWFEDNLGWLFGLPLGSLLTIALEILVLAKKSKAKVEELKETKDANKFIKEQIEIGNEMYTKGVELFDVCKETITTVETNFNELSSVLTDKVNDIAKRLDNTDNLVIETKNTFDALNGIIEANKVEIEKLQQALLLVSTHTKELVANSTAEEIVKLVKGE